MKNVWNLINHTMGFLIFIRKSSFLLKIKYTVFKRVQMKNKDGRKTYDFFQNPEKKIEIVISDLKTGKIGNTEKMTTV